MAKNVWFMRRNAKGRMAVGVRKTHRLLKYRRRVIFLFGAEALSVNRVTHFRSVAEVESFFGCSKSDMDRAREFFGVE